MRDGPISRPIAALSLLAALASGGYGTVFWLTHDSGPPPEAFPEAARIVREAYEPSDRIFLVPHYATRAREYLGDLHPLAVRDPLREDLAIHPRVWVFGLFDAAEALRTRMTRAGHRLTRSWELSSGITIDLYETTGAFEVIYDFVERLDRATVYHERKAERVACDRRLDTNGQGGALGRWSCPYDAEWFYVAPEWHRMGDHLRLCLWAHPPHEGRLVIEYPNVPMTGHLVGRGGHTLNASVRARAPIDLDLAVEGAGVQRFRFALEEHYEPFMLKTPEIGTATVTFAISSSDAGANHFCFRADMRRERPRS